MGKNDPVKSIKAEMTEIAEALAASAERANLNGDNGCHDGGRSKFVERVMAALKLIPKDCHGPEAQAFLVKYSGGAYGPNALPQVSWREQNPQFFKDEDQIAA